MKTNMGFSDRATRLIAAAILFALFFSQIVTGILAIILVCIAAVFVLTAIIGSCPLYSLLGINTCRKKTE